MRLGLLILVILPLWITSCSLGVRSYEQFRGAVNSGASCAQLIDIKEDNFEGTSNEARIENDLREIGCVSRRSSRTDN